MNAPSRRHAIPRFVALTCLFGLATLVALVVPSARAEDVPDVSDLPLFELPATTTPSDGKGDDVFAFVSSGDGGFSGLDRRIGEVLAREGMPVVGFDTRLYYLEPHTPEASSADLARVLEHYLATWHEERAVLFGYSRGADAMPWMVADLPPELAARIDSIVLLGAGTRTNFRFRPGDVIDEVVPDGALTLPAHERLGGRRILCIYGLEEPDSVCPDFPPGLADVVGLETDHHFDGDAEGLAKRVLELARGDAGG